MNIKKFISHMTGYWLHKRSTLPVGVDIFQDIQYRFNYGTLSNVFDVGANVGQTAKWIRHYLPNVTIVSFEPVSSVYTELIRNTRNIRNMLTECVALGEEEKEVMVKLHKEFTVLNSLKTELMSHDIDSLEEKIKVTRLDNYCHKNEIDHIDLLKIDTEGYEINVLKGATRMLTEARISFVLCEVGFLRQNERNTYFADICEYLSAYGYYFQGLYQVSGHSWDPQNVFGNVLFVHQNYFVTPVSK